MIDLWTRTQALFTAWPQVPATGATATLRRLEDALAAQAAGHAQAAGWRDIAALTRQVLLEAAARGNNTGLEVPLDPLLPSRQQWESMACRTLPTSRGLRIFALPWHPRARTPQAMEAASKDLEQIFLGADSPQRRHLEPQPADPYWIEALGYQQYVSVGQQQAARTVALAPPGSTTIVCLPTGHGKTAVVQASALLAGARGGVSVVVVPTVILALDMEARTQRLLASQGRHSPTGRYAYTGGMEEDTKKKICDDIRTGRQRLLFTSPEAVVTALKKPLEDAAEAGLLQYFVIDEAHLVEHWGTGFRPEFQTMASHRRTWLRKAPAGQAPVTVAMSATLTQQQVTLLEQLFSEAGQAEVVWASQLRHEPSYYVDFCPDASSRHDAVIDAIAMLPRPMVLYTTQVKDALAWADRLLSAGFQRVIHVTGKSSDDQRRTALEGWSGTTPDGPVRTQFDVVVGTSAFGLGVDLTEVRTVIHACLPETTDRYYQEVGRAGRDGNPCIAYMATAPEDQRIAETLNRSPQLTAERAWDRWRAMWLSRAATPSGAHRISLEALPADMSEGYGQHRTWNERILNLMVRAGLITVTVPEPPQREDDETEKAWQDRSSAFYEVLGKQFDISLLDGQTNDRPYFLEHFNQIRQQIIADQHTAAGRLQAILRSDRCWAQALAEHYRISHRGGTLPTAVTCRGCPPCRKDGPPADPAEGYYHLAVEPAPLVRAWPALQNDPLRRFRGDASSLSIYWETEREFNDLVPDLLERLAARGMPVIGGPGLSRINSRRLQRDVRPRPVILDTDEELLGYYSNPMIWVLSPSASCMDDDLAMRFESQDVTYVLHPRSLAHPDRPDTPLVAIHRAHLWVRTALESL
ncbi:protein DpdF [Streptomyces sp. NPDC058486]|uniref:protein DpdF n=1 Tax=unclassified Streptomyces TaxID=2593676 RepID=UPI00364C98CD